MHQRYPRHQHPLRGLVTPISGLLSTAELTPWPEALTCHGLTPHSPTPFPAVLVSSYEPFYKLACYILCYSKSAKERESPRIETQRWREVSCNRARVSKVGGLKTIIHTHIGHAYIPVKGGHTFHSAACLLNKVGHKLKQGADDMFQVAQTGWSHHTVPPSWLLARPPSTTGAPPTRLLPSDKGARLYCMISEGHSFP